MLFDPKWMLPAAPEIEPWRKSLLDAAEYICKYGWCQGALRDGETSLRLGGDLNHWAGRCGGTKVSPMGGGQCAALER